MLGAGGFVQVGIGQGLFHVFACRLNLGKAGFDPAQTSLGGRIDARRCFGFGLAGIGCLGFVGWCGGSGIATAQPGGVIVKITIEGFDPALGHAPETVTDQPEQVAVVADQNDGAGIVSQRLSQGFAHIQIQMVGRFVQQQYVGSFPGQQRQSQARAFATGKAIDDFKGPIPGEIPTAQIIAQGLLAGLRSHDLQMLDRTGAVLQGLDGVLGKIADAQIRVGHALTVQQGQLSDQSFDQGRFAGAVGSQQADPITCLKGEIHAAQDPVLYAIATIGLAQLQQRGGQLFGRIKMDLHRALGAYGFGSLEFFQTLHS